MGTRKIKTVLVSTILALLTLVSLGGCVIVHRDDDFEHHHFGRFYWDHD